MDIMAMHDEQQPHKQGAQPRRHPLLGPAFSACRRALCSCFSLSFCHFLF